jgi:hypothetical protein
MFLMWYDDGTKKTTAQKITEGCAAYAARFKMAAGVVLVSEGETVAIEGLDIRPLARIERNSFHIGAAAQASVAPPR